MKYMDVINKMLFCVKLRYLYKSIGRPRDVAKAKAIPTFNAMWISMKESRIARINFLYFK